VRCRRLALLAHPDAIPDRKAAMIRSATILLVILFASIAELHAATVADLAGTWVVDNDATWEKLKKMPELAALPAEQLPLVKSTFETQFKSASFEFADGKLTSTVNGEKKEETFKVTKTEGNSLFTDDTASDGKVTHSRVDVGADQLVVVNMDNPTQAIVLRRKSAAAK
jgi:hypothetical protein